MSQLKINVEWDNEAAVWVATSNDVEGLAIEANTIDDLIGQLKIVIPILVPLNRNDFVENELPFLLVKTWSVTNDLSAG